MPKEVPRLPIAAHRLRGSISLLGARLDDLVLTDYRETLAPNSPNVRLLEPRSDEHPYYVQYGWSAAPGEQVKLPDNDTVWTGSGGTLSAGHPVTLSWDNGAGLTFQLTFSVDDDYMFTVQQSVKNATGTPVKLFPWSRIRRDYTPQVAGYYILFEGLLGVVDGRLQETTYANAKSEGEKKNGIAYEATATGGWAGITDKYWLTALVPDQAIASTVNFQPHHRERRPLPGGLRHAGAEDDRGERRGLACPRALFAGAKIVRLLDRYQAEDHIPNFDKAVDFGWFYFLTKPIFYCLDWLYGLLGNFGLAILAFTLFVKLLFFPLANYSYRSMSKMKLLAPKMQALRERFKDEPQRMQQEMMAMYRTEKVNPASGCLPMVVQIPVFFSLYKVIFVTIEMRQAPFFGWIHDLSAVDPTNIFNLFGLIPFNPATISPWFHLGPVAADHGRHDVPAAEAEPAAARSGAGADVPVHADHLHLHAGELPGRAGDLLELEQPAVDRAAMADHAADAPGATGARAHLTDDEAALIEAGRAAVRRRVPVRVRRAAAGSVAAGRRARGGVRRAVECRASRRC